MLRACPHHDASYNWDISTPLLTGDVNNINHIVPWVLASMCMPFDISPSSKHCCRRSAPPHVNVSPWWILFYSLMLASMLLVCVHVWLSGTTVNTFDFPRGQTTWCMNQLWSGITQLLLLTYSFSLLPTEQPQRTMQHSSHLARGLSCGWFVVRMKHDLTPIEDTWGYLIHLYNIDFPPLWDWTHILLLLVTIVWYIWCLKSSCSLLWRSLIELPERKFK